MDDGAHETATFGNVGDWRRDQDEALRLLRDT
jgi:hypothetical protein